MRWFLLHNFALCLIVRAVIMCSCFLICFLGRLNRSTLGRAIHLLLFAEIVALSGGENSQGEQREALWTVRRQYDGNAAPTPGHCVLSCGCEPGGKAKTRAWLYTQTFQSFLDTGNVPFRFGCFVSLHLTCSMVVLIFFLGDSSVKREQQEVLLSSDVTWGRQIEARPTRCDQCTDSWCRRWLCEAWPNIAGIAGAQIHANSVFKDCRFSMSCYSWLRKRVRESAEVRDLKRQAANLEFCKCLWRELVKPANRANHIQRWLENMTCNVFFLFWSITTFSKSVMWWPDTSWHAAMSCGRLLWCVHSGRAGNTDLANWTWRIESSGWLHGIKSHRIKFFPCWPPHFKVGSMRGSFSEVPGSLGWQLGGKATLLQRCLCFVQSVGSISSRLQRCRLRFCRVLCMPRCAFSDVAVYEKSITLQVTTDETTATQANLFKAACLDCEVPLFHDAWCWSMFMIIVYLIYIWFILISCSCCVFTFLSSFLRSNLSDWEIFKYQDVKGLRRELMYVWWNMTKTFHYVPSIGTM